MRSLKNIETPILDTANRLSSLSLGESKITEETFGKNRNDSEETPKICIVIDDFDSAKGTSKDCKPSQEPPAQLTSAKPYTRQSSDASIKKILEEAEHRKHEFWKLLDEHNAVIENLKRIEQLEHGVCKVQSPIST